MIYTLKAMIHQGEQSGFIAECLELPIVTQGLTLDEVVRNLREAITLHLEGEDLTQLGFTIVSQKGSHVKLARILLTNN